MEALLNFDRELLLLLNPLGSPAFDSFWIIVSGTAVWIPLYVVFLYLLKKNNSWRNMAFILLFIALGVTTSDQLANVFKYGIERLRPCHEPSLEGLIREVKCGGSFGFYSAHASNTFFLGTFLTLLLGKTYRLLPWALFLWAGTVAYSRIYLGVHYPLDVLYGASVGFLLGGFYGALTRKVLSKRVAAV